MNTLQDQSFEESNSLCKDCNEKIEKAFGFKTCLLSPKEAPGLEDIPSTSHGETSAEKVICVLCKTLVNKLSVISLQKLLKDDSMMELFQGHLDEVVSY